MTGAFTKVFVNNDLYNTTEEEITKLENWPTDPSVRRDAKKIYRPLFDDYSNKKRNRLRIFSTVHPI